MTIATLQALELGQQQKITVVKGSLAGLTINSPCSLWQATSSLSQPAPGATPGAAAICDGTSLTGSLVWTPHITGQRTYVYSMQFSTGFAGGEIMLADRLGAMGGLSGTVTTAQTVGLDLNANLATLNISGRIGRSDFSEVLWMLEVYVAIGGTTATATVAFTYNDGTTDTQAITLTANTRFQAQLLPILPNAAGKYIRSVESVTLSGTTGTAGSFGVTAYRPLFNLASLGYVTFPVEQDWGSLARVHANACLQLITLPASTNTSTITGLVRLIQG